MNNIKNTRHATYMINYHMVWIPKYRRKILVNEIAGKTEEILHFIAKERGWDILALEVMPDHVHLFVSAPPKFSPADIVKVFKGWSARCLLKEFPGLGQKTGRGTLWAPSYYIGTAGTVSSETIKKYIEECQDR
jgi:putative transposase